jgi:hypothetical protein
MEKSIKIDVVANIYNKPTMVSGIMTLDLDEGTTLTLNGDLEVSSSEEIAVTATYSAYGGNDGARYLNWIAFFRPGPDGEAFELESFDNYTEFLAFLFVQCEERGDYGDAQSFYNFFNGDETPTSNPMVELFEAFDNYIRESRYDDDDNDNDENNQ